MSWLFSRALAAEFLAAGCSAGEPSAPSNLTSTPDAFLWPDKTTDASSLARYGMTFELLTERRGAALLTSFLAAFRAKTSAAPADAPASTASEADSGARWLGSFAKYSPDTCWWRTPPTLFPEGSVACSPIWPTWGWMRNGECLALTTLTRRTRATESGLLPTPVASESLHGFQISAEYEAKRKAQRRGIKLGQWLYRRGRADLANSPTFREWMMAWPIGWTDCAPLETARFQQWLASHGAI